MRLVTFKAGSPFGKVRRLGSLIVLAGTETVVDLQIAYLSYLRDQKVDPPEAQRLASTSVPDRMEAFIAAGRPAMSAASSALEFVLGAGPRAVVGPGGIGGTSPAAQTTFLSPLLQPNSLRDFIAFEDHAKAGAARRGEDLNPVWYDRPIYYKGNHRSLIGSEDDLPRPGFTTELDFELEVACIVGSAGRDLDEPRAGESIFGFTIMNDWSARDVQKVEMSARLGPAKSKDFATSLGPCVVTADEVGVDPSLAMTARVNGRVVCEANLSNAYWKFPRLISYVSQGEQVWPTDIYGSGTPLGGCLLDQGGPYLEPGDVVELEVERIGLLRNRIV